MQPQPGRPRGPSCASPTPPPKLGRAGSYLLKQLQAVGVVIVGEEEHSGLRALVLVPLAQPGETGVTLLRGARQSRPLVAPRCGHVQVRAGQPGPRQEAAHQLAARRRVLHQDPVQLRHLAESVGQAGQLGFLHRAAVGGRDGIDGGQRRLGPRPWLWPRLVALLPAAPGANVWAAPAERVSGAPAAHRVGRKVGARGERGRGSARVHVEHDDDD